MCFGYGWLDFGSACSLLLLVVIACRYTGTSYCCIRRLNLSANLDMGNRVCTTQDSENIADVPPSVRCAFLPREPIVQTTA